MTTILCVGDIHAMDRAPSGCVEPYLDDLIDMLGHAARIAEELGADATVWAGDVFHYKAPGKTSHATVMRLIEVARKFKNLYILVGNHDISNDRLESVDEKQPLGVLFASGAAKMLDGKVDGLPLYGIPWQQDWDEEGTLERVFAAAKSSSPQLTVTHASIYPPAQVENVPFTVLDANKIADALGSGHVYYGHIHEYHGIYDVGAVEFANMGAISRGSLHEYNVERGIYVAMWSEATGFGEIPLPHKPAAEVLKIEVHREKKIAAQNLDDFLSSVGRSSLTLASTASVIHAIESMTVEAPVKVRAVELVEQAQQA